MDQRLLPLAAILRLNTRLFRNCLDGLADEAAAVRPSPATNNAVFVAAHLVDSRCFFLRALGVEHANPLARYLEGARGIDDLREHPPLAEIGAGWTEVSHALRDRLAAVTAAELDAPTPTPFPGGEQLLDAIAFLVQHDSYHIGQLALLRKYAGLPAMKYS